MPFYTGLTRDLFIDQAIHFQARPQNLSQTIRRIQVAQQEPYCSSLLHIELLLALAGMLQQNSHHGKWRLFSKRIFFYSFGLDWSYCNYKSWAKRSKGDGTTLLHWDLLILAYDFKILHYFLKFPKCHVFIYILTSSFHVKSSKVVNSKRNFKHCSLRRLYSWCFQKKKKKKMTTGFGD